MKKIVIKYSNTKRAERNPEKDEDDKGFFFLPTVICMSVPLWHIQPA
jgi:hypothetical protein